MTPVAQEDKPCPLPRALPVLDGDPAGSTGPCRVRLCSLKWTQQAQRLREAALVFYFAFKHPRTPWYAKLVAVCAAGYLLSPVQLIPNYIPVIGSLDDLAVLLVGAKLLRRIIPDDVLAECLQRASDVETRRKEEIKSAAATLGAAAIICAWFLVAAIASVFMVRYVFR